MKVVMLTREYPPHIYGGAGVVVGELSRALSRRMGVEVRCFGERAPSTDGAVVLRTTKGNKTLTASLLGVDPRTVSCKLERWDEEAESASRGISGSRDVVVLTFADRGEPLVDRGEDLGWGPTSST